MHRNARYRDAPPGVGEGVPLHLWIVGLFSLAWNAFGALDYVMTNLGDPDYLASFPPELIAMIDAMPLWAHASWALGVWGSLLGSVLLLARRHQAFGAFAASLFGLAVSTIWQRTMALPGPIETPGMVWMNVAIWVVVVGLVLYSRRMAEHGILR